MKLLTYWQRIALIEYLMVHDNLPRCRTVAQALVDEAYSIVDEQDYRGLGSVEEVGAATAHLNTLLSEAVERWLDLHKLYNHRDSSQFQVIRDRGEFRPVPRGIVRMMLDGESKIDLFEFHKMPDGTLKNMAAPYFVEDLDAPLAQADRDRMTEELTAWLQPTYQWQAAYMLKADIERELRKFKFDHQGQELLVQINQHVQEQFGQWLSRHPYLRAHDHQLSVHAAQVHDEYQIVFSSDFALLNEGKYPLDFVRITKDVWTDHAVRSAHHQEFLKHLKWDTQHV